MIEKEKIENEIMGGKIEKRSRERQLAIFF